VLLLERDSELVRSLQASKVRLKAEKLRVEAADAIAWMSRSAPARFELVMLDPPFDGGLFEPAIQAAAPLLVPGGYLYVESPEPIEPAAGLGLEAHRNGRAGAVHYALFHRNG
jgi:16S rRNA G966 N2-methylase RsmD